MVWVRAWAWRGVTWRNVHPRVDGVREHVQKGHSDDGAGREDDGEGSKNRGRVHASSGGASEEGRVDPFLDCGLHRLASEATRYEATVACAEPEALPARAAAGAEGLD